MSNIEGTRTNPTFTDTIKVPKGTATVIADRISSVECPKCGYHIRAGHRPSVYCRSCKQEITVDSEYRFLMSSKVLSIRSLEYSWHPSCYEKAVHEGELREE